MVLELALKSVAFRLSLTSTSQFWLRWEISRQLNSRQLNSSRKETEKVTAVRAKTKRLRYLEKARCNWRQSKTALKLKT